ncbi:MAG TPA: hypothetical protein VGE62_01280 [Candidatus Paceibacterota bacterium]
MNKEQITHIIPAVFAVDYNDFVDQLDSIYDIVSRVQIDVVDGSFATKKTWPFDGDAGQEFPKIVRQEQGLPHWEEVEFEVDIMSQNTAFVVDQWIAAGASRVIVHKRNVTDSESLLKIAEAVREKGVEFMVAFEPKETLELIKDFAGLVIDGGFLDGIQVMGIDKVGFQNQDFNPKALQLIASIRKEWPDMPLSVDGGVSFDNARALIDAGATRLVSGSAIMHSEMPRDAIERFEEICQD